MSVKIPRNSACFKRLISGAPPQKPILVPVLERMGEIPVHSVEVEIPVHSVQIPVHSVPIPVHSAQVEIPVHFGSAQCRTTPFVQGTCDDGLLYFIALDALRVVYEEVGTHPQ